MADKNIQMQRKKADGTFDAFFPLTKAANVSLLDAGGLFAAGNVEGALAELFTSVSSGKAQLETAVTDMEGTVSKAGAVATFAELDAGIRSISTGYAVGDIVPVASVQAQLGAMRYFQSLPYSYGYDTGFIGVKASPDGQGLAWGNYYYTFYRRGSTLYQQQDPGQQNIAQCLFDRLNQEYAYGVSVGWVSKIRANATPLLWQGSPGGNVAAARPDGGVVVAQYNQINSYTAAGAKTLIVSGIGNNYYGMVCDADGNIYVATYTALFKYTSSGTLVWQKNASQLAGGLPISLAIDEAGGRLFYTCLISGFGQIACCDLDGNALWATTGTTTNISTGRFNLHYDTVHDLLYTSVSYCVHKFSPEDGTKLASAEIPSGYLSPGHITAADDTGVIYLRSYSGSSSDNLLAYEQIATGYRIIG